MKCVDIMFIESRAHGIFPAISLWRGKGEKAWRKDAVALFTTEPEKDLSTFQFDLNDVDAAEMICLFLAGK